MSETEHERDMFMLRGCYLDLMFYQKLLLHTVLALFAHFIQESQNAMYTYTGWVKKVAQ